MDRRDLASRLRWWHSHNGRTAEMVAYGEEDEDGEPIEGEEGEKPSESDDSDAPAKDKEAGAE